MRSLATRESQSAVCGSALPQLLEFQQLAMSPQGFTLAEFARVAGVGHFPRSRRLPLRSPTERPLPTAFPRCAPISVSGRYDINHAVDHATTNSNYRTVAARTAKRHDFTNRSKPKHWPRAVASVGHVIDGRHYPTRLCPSFTPSIQILAAIVVGGAQYHCFAQSNGARNGGRHSHSLD